MKFSSVLLVSLNLAASAFSSSSFSAPLSSSVYDIDVPKVSCCGMFDSHTASVSVGVDVDVHTVSALNSPVAAVSCCGMFDKPVFASASSSSSSSSSESPSVSCCGMFDKPAFSSSSSQSPSVSCCGMFDTPASASGFDSPSVSCCGMFDTPASASGSPSGSASVQSPAVSCCGMFDTLADSAPSVSCCGMFDTLSSVNASTTASATVTAPSDVTVSAYVEARRLVSLVTALPVMADIRLKLTHPVYGPPNNNNVNVNGGSKNGWSPEFVDRAIVEYARFLALAHVFGEAVPSNVIDEVWHSHIIDTRRYEADCVSIFGRFLHHYPYFGLGGKHGEHSALVEKFDRTMTRYKTIFGDVPSKGVWGPAPTEN